MNILVIARYKGGSTPATIYIHDQVKALARAGHNAYLVAPKPLFKDKDSYPSDYKIKNIVGVNYVIPPYFSFSNLGEYSLNNWTFHYSVNKTVDMLRKRGFTPHIIHAHMFSAPSYSGVKLQDKIGAPCIITTHGSDLRLPIKAGRSDMIIKRAKAASGIITISEGLSEMLTELDPSIETTVITNGFNLIEFSSYHKEPYLITSCGNLVESKKFDILIKSFANIAFEFPQAKLQIIGQGVLDSELHNIAKDSGLDQRISFLGHLPNQEVIKEMNRSEIFALPSVNEGFGIVYMEAMSQQCLVIATQGEGFSHIVKNEKECILVEPNSVMALTEALRNVFLEKEKHQKIAIDGYKFALDYSWDHNVEKTTELFNDVLHKQMESNHRKITE